MPTVFFYSEKKQANAGYGGEDVEEDTNNTSLTLGVFAAMTAIFFFGVSAVATRRL